MTTTPTDWSLNETKATARKAARGAGYPWGLAIEAGYAVEWLQARGLNGAQALGQYLLWRESNDPGEACPLKIGCRIGDFATWENILAGKVVQPILLIPFITSVYEDTPVLLHSGDAKILFNEQNIEHESLSTLLEDGFHHCTLSLSDQAPKESSCVSRVPWSAAEAVRILEKFAFDSYAPATEESRLAGAGAGLNDND